jgi:biopolymer transport protein ExbD
MEFKKKSKQKIEVPTSAMPDIIFMLLIFFMVTTVLKTYQGLSVKIPEAKAAQKIELSKRHIINLWIDKRANVVCNDFRVKEIKKLGTFVQSLMAKNPYYKPIIKMDHDADMGMLIDVQQQLRKGQALAIFYAARPTE